MSEGEQRDIEVNASALHWLGIASSSAGIAFVLSGIANWAIFYFYYDLNFFHIASAEDIVLYAFLLFAFFGTFALIGIVVQIPHKYFGQSLSPRLDAKMTQFSDRMRYLLVALILFIFGFSLYFLLESDRMSGERNLFDQFISAFYESNTITDGDRWVEGCGEARVIWSGSDALFIECHETRRYVVKNATDVILSLPIERERVTDE